jgi:hypothetical protein
MSGLAFVLEFGYLGCDAAEEQRRLDASDHYRR